MKTNDELLQKQLDRVVNDLENHAEDANYHSMYRIYKQLVTIIQKHAGLEATVKIMKEIRKSGGLLP